MFIKKDWIKKVIVIFYFVSSFTYYLTFEALNLFHRTKNSEETENDELKNICCDDGDKKQRLDTLWAIFKDGINTKQVNETATSCAAKPTTSKAYEFAGEEVK